MDSSSICEESCKADTLFTNIQPDYVHVVFRIAVSERSVERKVETENGMR